MVRSAEMGKGMFARQSTQWLQLDARKLKEQKACRSILFLQDQDVVPIVFILILWLRELKLVNSNIHSIVTMKPSSLGGRTLTLNWI